MKKRVLTILAALAAAAVSAAAQNLVTGSIEGVTPQGSYMPTFASDGAAEAPLNVILMIGDGTGLAHYASGYFANGEELTVMNLKHMGWVTTKSSNRFTTDSAASGTAYSAGIKTYNGSIGLDDDRQSVPNIPELIEPEGIISAVVTTDNLDGATPACFFAHQENRRMSKEIWADLPASHLTFFAAGHETVYELQPEATRRAIEEVFTIVKSLDDPRAAGSARLGYLPPKSETTYIKKGRTDFLPVSTRYAIDFLRARTNPGKGFFMMVEGARIDKASHANDYDSMVLELLDFDKAITEAIKFADEDGHTLVVICADHETGGTFIWDGDPSKGNVSGGFVSGGHTAIPIPIFAYGPHAQDFMGVQGNNEVSLKIQKLLLGER